MQGPVSLYGLSGVYRIVNEATGREYIGASVNLGRRFSVHRSTLNRGKHSNRELAHDWLAAGGVIAFRFEVLRYVPREQIRLAEQEALDSAFSRGWPYNIQPSSESSVGQKLRHRRPGSDFHREFARQLGSRPKTDEHKAKLSAAQRGRPLSPAHRAALRQAWTKRKERASWA